MLGRAARGPCYASWRAYCDSNDSGLPNSGPVTDPCLLGHAIRPDPDACVLANTGGKVALLNWPGKQSQEMRLGGSMIQVTLWLILTCEKTQYGCTLIKPAPVIRPISTYTDTRTCQAAGDLLLKTLKDGSVGAQAVCLPGSPVRSEPTTTK